MELSNLLSYCKASPTSSSLNESDNDNSNVIDIREILKLKKQRIIIIKRKYEKMIAGYRKFVFDISNTNNNELYYII